MGLLDRARAAYDAGRKEEAARQESAAIGKKAEQDMRQGAREYQRQKAVEEEERNPSRISRAAGRVMYRGEQLAERASYYGGRIASEVERMDTADKAAREKERASRPTQRGSGKIVQRPTQRTSSLWGFTPSRSQATRSITPPKRKPRKKQARDPLDFHFDFW